MALCNTTDYSPPGSSVRGILQAKILEWVVISSCKGSSGTRGQTSISYVSRIDREVFCLFVFTTNATWEAQIEDRYCDFKLFVT